MFVVIFEVQPKPDRWDQYLGLAAMLRPELERIEGFIDNERFRSERTEGRLLSLSTWANEKALIRWRTHAVHHGVQEKGRSEVFADYHLRVGEVTADAPAGAAKFGQRFDLTETGAAKSVTITGAIDDLGRLPPPGTGGVIDVETYASITTAGKRIALVSWRDGPAWPDAGPDRRTVRIIRDYAMRDRREAAQYYPAV